VQFCREEIEEGWDMDRQTGTLRSIVSEEQWIQYRLKEQCVKKLLSSVAERLISAAQTCCSTYIHFYNTNK
jgi:hypothetical protein